MSASFLATVCPTSGWCDHMELLGGVPTSVDLEVPGHLRVTHRQLGLVETPTIQVCSSGPHLLQVVSLISDFC